MKKLFTILAAALSPMLALADGTIRGTVTSKDTGEPLDYVQVVLEDAKTGEIVSNAETDEAGRYTFLRVPSGNYMVKITCIGTVPQARPVKVGDGDVTIDNVRLAEDSKMLKEIEVVGVRGQMKFELDRKVFNVDSNIAAAGVSASELLESIPSVEVDQDGEVSLRGNSSVTVWINGKESGLTSDNRAQILEQIPAETIEKIEVITNPSAKYSPEGTAGIINIVLKKNRQAGYFGSAEIGANTRGGANANVNINLNSGKWEAFAGLGLRMRHNTNGSTSDRQYDHDAFPEEDYLTDPADKFLRSTGEGKNHGDNIFLRLGVTYHATDKDEIGISGFGMLGHRWGHSSTLYEGNLPGQWIKNNNYSGNRGDNRGAHGELTYKHLWSDTHYIELMGGFNHWGGPSLNTFLQEQTWAGGVPDRVYQEQEMSIKNNSAEVKLDYTNQLTSWLKLEAGYNGNFNHENTPNTTYSGTSKEDMTLNEALYNRFIYDNDIHALYATLGGKVSGFSFSAGLRGEAWQVHTWSLGYGETKSDANLFKKNNFALFPSAFLSYSLPHDNEIQVNYTRRIRRPWGGQLNSFVDVSNPTNYRYGNPELLPQYSNSFELNYLKTWTYHMISVSAYLRSSEQDMNRISYLDGDILYSTWANVGTTTNSGVEIVVKNNLFRVLDLTTTANLYNRHIGAWTLDFVNDGKTFTVSGNKQDNFAWDIRCMASVKLPWQLSFQATGRYNSRQVTAQGSREPGWTVDCGLRKNVGNWSFSVNCRDLFDSRKWHSMTIGDNYTQEDERWHGGRRVMFTVKYSFGNMKSNKKPGRDSEEPMDGSGYGSEMEM